MASFAMVVEMPGRTARVSWRDGELDAPDPEASALIRERAGSGEWSALPGVGSWRSGLDQPLQALATCECALRHAGHSTAVVESDVRYPPPPEPPAVA